MRLLLPSYERRRRRIGGFTRAVARQLDGRCRAVGRTPLFRDGGSNNSWINEQWRSSHRPAPPVQPPSDSARESASCAMPLPPCVPCSRKEAAASRSQSGVRVEETMEAERRRRAASQSWSSVQAEEAAEAERLPSYGGEAATTVSASLCHEQALLRCPASVSSSLCCLCFLLSGSANLCSCAVLEIGMRNLLIWDW